MKTFNKVLALVLTLITVVAMLPISAFADAWVSVDSKTEGSSSTVTLTLDAGALADILERDGISPSLLQDIKAGISVDVNALREAFTVEELLEIIPRESWLNIFDVEEIVTALGIDGLSKYVDLAELLKEIEPAKLADLLSTIPELENYVDVSNLIHDGFVDVALVGEYLDMDKLVADIENGTVTVDESELKAELASMTPEQIYGILDVKKLIADPDLLDTMKDAVDGAAIKKLVANGALTTNDCIDEDGLTNVLIDKYSMAPSSAALAIKPDGSLDMDTFENGVFFKSGILVQVSVVLNILAE